MTAEMSREEAWKEISETYEWAMKQGPGFGALFGGFQHPLLRLKPVERLEYALRYVALGWAIFPCRPNEKRPATQHGCLDATTDPEQIWAWWKEQPDLNIALACGEISGITALDIDPRSNGHEFLAAAIDDNEPIDGVWESQTGGGGTHYLFTYDHEANVDLAPGVEIKSDGKYIVLPPSTHPNGNTYEWELSSSPIEEYENDQTDAPLAAGDGADEESIFGPLRQPTTSAT